MAATATPSAEQEPVVTVFDQDEGRSSRRVPTQFTDLFLGGEVVVNGVPHALHVDEAVLGNVIGAANKGTSFYRSDEPIKVVDICPTDSLPSTWSVQENSTDVAQAPLTSVNEVIVTAPKTASNSDFTVAELAKKYEDGINYQLMKQILTARGLRRAQMRTSKRQIMQIFAVGSLVGGAIGAKVAQVAAENNGSTAGEQIAAGGMGAIVGVVIMGLAVGLENRLDCFNPAKRHSRSATRFMNFSTSPRRTEIINARGDGNIITLVPTVTDVDESVVT